MMMKSMTSQKVQRSIRARGPKLARLKRVFAYVRACGFRDPRGI